MTPPYVRLAYFALAVIHGVVGIGIFSAQKAGWPWQLVFTGLASVLLIIQLQRYIGLAISNENSE